jgi:hypothetical protein
MTTVREGLVQMIDRALGGDPRAALIAARQLEEECDRVTRRGVALARREGWNWDASADSGHDPPGHTQTIPDGGTLRATQLHRRRPHPAAPDDEAVPW